MLLIGLTGSIATGKSTVSSMLSAPPHSLPIIDADQLARKVVEPGTRGYRAIVRHFGPSTPDLLMPREDGPEDGPEGKGAPLNRAALGRRVFGNGSDEVARNRAVLNGIVHPLVRWEMLKLVVWHYLGGSWAVVLDVPLLFEGGLDVVCGTTMVVAVSEEETQMRRLMARDGHLSKGEAEDRVRSQGDAREKAERSRARGGEVLWNDGTREDLARQLGEAMGRIRGESPWWWSWVVLGVPPLAVGLAVLRVWRNLRANQAWEREKSKL